MLIPKETDLTDVIKSTGLKGEVLEENLIFRKTGFKYANHLISSSVVSEMQAEHTLSAHAGKRALVSDKLSSLTVIESSDINLPLAHGSQITPTSNKRRKCDFYASVTSFVKSR